MAIRKECFVSIFGGRVGLASGRILVAAPPRRVLIAVLLTLITLSNTPLSVAAEESEAPAAPAAPPAPGTREYFDLVKAKYEAEKAANDAAAAALASKYPSGDVTKPTAAVTFSGDALPIAEQLSLRAAGKLGIAIGKAAKTKCANVAICKFLVTTRSDIAALGAERVWFENELKRRTASASSTAKALSDVLSSAQQRIAEGEKARPPTKFGTPFALGADAILKAGVSLLGYFKADYEVQGRGVTTDEEALLSGITAALNTSSVREGWAVPDGNSPVLASLNQLNAQLLLGAQSASALKSIEAKLTELEKAAFTSLAAILTDHSAFVTSTAQAGADGKPGLLQRIIANDHLFNPAITHVLYAKFVRGGAMAVSKKHLFQLSPRLSFVGVATVSYTLTTATDGTVAASGTEGCTWPMKIVLADVGKVVKKDGKPTPNKLGISDDALECTI